MNDNLSSYLRVFFLSGDPPPPPPPPPQKKKKKKKKHPYTSNSSYLRAFFLSGDPPKNGWPPYIYGYVPPINKQKNKQTNNKTKQKPPKQNKTKTKTSWPPYTSSSYLRIFFLSADPPEKQLASIHLRVYFLSGGPPKKQHPYTSSSSFSPLFFFPQWRSKGTSGPQNTSIICHKYPDKMSQTYGSNLKTKWCRLLIWRVSLGIERFRRAY